jgi:hypothetical protein
MFRTSALPPVLPRLQCDPTHPSVRFLLILALPAEFARKSVTTIRSPRSRILDAPVTPAVLPSHDGWKLFCWSSRACPIGQVARRSSARRRAHQSSQQRAVPAADLFHHVVQPIGKAIRDGSSSFGPGGECPLGSRREPGCLTLLEEGGTSLWLADASSGAIACLRPTLNGAFGPPCRWMPSGKSCSV